MPLETPIQVPEEPTTDEIQDRRLWVGNLDVRVTEFQLLKLFQQFGTIEKFDLLFHKTGPSAGQPKGYAFVTFAKSIEAQTMMEEVNSKLLGTRRLSVKWAHAMSKSEIEKPKIDLNIPALVGGNKEKKVNIQSQIQAIESKLKMMEKSSDDFKISNEPSTSFTFRGSQNQTRNIAKKPFTRTNHNRHGPYRK